MFRAVRDRMFSWPLPPQMTGFAPRSGMGRSRLRSSGGCGVPARTTVRSTLGEAEHALRETLRMCANSSIGRSGTSGTAELRLAEVLLAGGDAGRAEEAAGLLEAVRPHARAQWFLRDLVFRYLLASARAARLRHDPAVRQIARQALAVAAETAPALPRHPSVGRPQASEADIAELEQPICAHPPLSEGRLAADLLRVVRAGARVSYGPVSGGIPGGRWTMADGVGEARPEAEGELALARIALDDGELRHAAAHVGNAIASDPALQEAYEVLDELAARAGDAADLFPMTGNLYIGMVAARSYVLARSGATDEAFGLLCQVAATEPGKPWAAGWLAMPEASAAAFADGMDPDQAATSLMRLAGSLPDPADPGLVAPLTPFLQVARCIAACNPVRAGVLPLLSALARRLGAHDEAVAWCQRAELGTGSASAAIMLGYALRGAGRRDEMYQAWQRALSRDNRNVSLRVDIAEHLAADGRAEEGLAWLEEGLALEPDHAKAFPSACYLRFQLDGDVAHLARLADWWREHPQHEYAGKMLTMACYGRPWLGMVPWASEAVADVLRQFAKTRKPGEPHAGTVKRLALSALEVPSALSVLRSAQPGVRLTGIEPDEDPPAPDPDIRVPIAEGRYRLWAYAGVEARPVPPAPSDAAAAVVRSLAAGGYPPHPSGAYDLAVALAGLSLDDLLGLMAHAIPAPDTLAWQQVQRDDPTYWPRTAQAWACLGLLHHKADEPWPSSARRQVLVDLLRGVEDWATDAAMNALVVAAWADPAIRGDVAGLVATRFLDGLAASQKRAVSIIGPMAHLILATPDMDPDVSGLARQTL